MRIPRKEHPIMHHVKEVKLLVDNLNKHRHAYYNLNAPVISDAEYDRLYEQLESLERETGIIYSNSPTQTVGYPPVRFMPFLWRSRSFAYAEAGWADRKTHL